MHVLHMRPLFICLILLDTCDLLELNIVYEIILNNYKIYKIVIKKAPILFICCQPALLVYDVHRKQKCYQIIFVHLQNANADCSITEKAYAKFLKGPLRVNCRDNVI